MKNALSSCVLLFFLLLSAACSSDPLATGTGLATAPSAPGGGSGDDDQTGGGTGEEPGQPFVPVLVFSETFDAGSYTGAISDNSTWQHPSGAGAGTVSYSGNASVFLRRDNFGSTGRIGTYSGASGGGYLRLRENSTEGLLMVGGIGACGAKNFSLTFGAAQNSSYLRVEVSTDGKRWQEIAWTFSKTYNTWGLASGSFHFSVVPDKIYFKFTSKLSTANYGCNIDDLCLQTAEKESGTLVESAAAEDLGWAELPARVENADWFYHTHHSRTVVTDVPVRNYSYCYDTRRHNPVWVAYPLHALWQEGGYGRTDPDPWAPDPDLAESSQSVIWDDGSGYAYWTYAELRSRVGSGMWTRGHLCRSADRGGKGSNLNIQTFYPTNISPQTNYGRFADLWAAVENKVSDTWVCADTLYIVAGCYYGDETFVEYDAANYGVLSSKSKACVVPTHHFKMLVRTRAGNTGKPIQKCSASEVKAIGFWYDTLIPGDDTRTVADLAVSVDFIEQKMGINFFPWLAESVESTFSTADWGL